MKTIKRTVAALLATLMLATSTSFSLAAENYSDKEAVVVAKVNAAGIMTGTDKGFEPSKTLTRAEAAAIIVRMKGISESAVKTAAGATLFNDVAASHWASGYINQASNLGIVKGVSATEFAPDREVTIAEFVTMAIRALGAGTLVDSEGTWPTNYVNFANEEGLLDDVNAIWSATATRMNAATIVAHTLEADMWAKTKATTSSEVTWERATGTVITTDNRGRSTSVQYNKTILFDVLKLTKLTGVQVSAINFVDRKIKLGDDWEKVSDSFDLASVKLGFAYDGYYDADEKEVLGLWTAEDTDVETVEFTEITKVGSDFIRVMVNGEEKEFDFHMEGAPLAAVYTTYYNAVKENDNAKVVKSENLFGSIVMDTKEDEVKTIYLQEYTNVGVVKEVTDTRVKFESLDGTAYATASAFKLDDEDYTYFVTKDGASIEAKDIKADDVIFYYTEGTNSKVYHAMVANNSKEGKVTSIGSNYIKLDGTKYSVLTTADFDSSDFSTDDEIVVYMNEANKIVAFKEIEGTGNFAVISSLEFVKNNKGSVKAQVVLSYADGTKSDAMEVKLDDKKDNAITDLGWFIDYDEIDEYEDFCDEYIYSFITSEVVADGSTHNVINASMDGNEVLFDGNGTTPIKVGTTLYSFEDTAHVRHFYTNLGHAYSAAEAVDTRHDDSLKYGKSSVLADEKLLNAFVKANYANSVLGDVVDYKMDGSKVVILTNTDIEEKASGYGFVDSASKDYFVKGTRKVYTNDSTKALIVKKDDDKYKVKVSVVDIEDLESQAGMDVTFVDVDNKTNVAKLVVIDEISSDKKTAKGASTGNWGIVTDVTSSVSSDADYDYEVTVITSEGKEELYYSDSTLSPRYGEITLDGEEITDFDASDYNYASSLSLYIAKEEDGILYLCTDGASEGTYADTLVLADKVVYIEYDATAGEYSVGKARSVDFADVDTDDKYDCEDATKIVAVLEYAEETGAYEVVAIVYVINEI